MHPIFTAAHFQVSRRLLTVYGAPAHCGTRCQYQDSRREHSSGLPLHGGESLTELVERAVVNPVIRAAPWDPQRLQDQDRNPQACILLISESDVCRSVLAAACLRRMLQEAGLEHAVRVATCGTRPYNVGEGPEPAAAAAAEALGLELPPGHSARLFEPATDIVCHDLLLTMDKFTAGDVMREVSSFDLVNRKSPFAFKVRRLGEFLGGPTTAGSTAQYGIDGDELDIEDPLYGNVGGQEEEQAVLRSARLIREACRGLVAFLSTVQAQASSAPDSEGLQAGEAADAAAGVYGWGAEGQDEPACEVPLPGQAPACPDALSPSLEAAPGGAGVAGQQTHSTVPPLGPALRARVQTMGPTPWLVPPMLAPRAKPPAF